MEPIRQFFWTDLEKYLLSENIVPPRGKIHVLISCVFIMTKGKRFLEIVVAKLRTWRVRSRWTLRAPNHIVTHRRASILSLEIKGAYR